MARDAFESESGQVSSDASAYEQPPEEPQEGIEELVEASLLIEEVSIDGMCGVY